MKKTTKMFYSIVFILMSLSLFTFMTNAATSKTVGTVSKIKAVQTDDSITLSWTKAKNASGYRIYELISDKWVAMVTTKSSACILTDLSPGSEHTYAVKAYGKQSGKTVWSKYYKTFETATAPSKIKKLTVKTTSNSAALSWTKASGASAYRVFRYDQTSRSWKKIVTTTKTSYTVKSLTSGKSYIFAVRPYFKSGSTVLWASTYIKITVKTVANPVAKALAIESSGYNSNSNCIVLDVSSDGWSSDFVGGKSTAIVVVDGQKLSAPLKIPSSKNADGRYEIQIDLSDLGIRSGSTVNYTISEGTIKTKDGLQYNTAYSGSCDVS